MSGPFTIDDFKKGDFVELHNDSSPERWFGRITAIKKTRENPLAVHYLKKIGGSNWPDLPEDLDYYTWWEIQTGEQQKAEYWTEISCVIQVGRLFTTVTKPDRDDLPTKTLYLLTPGARNHEPEEPEESEEPEDSKVDAFKAAIEQMNTLKSYPRERVWGKKKKTKVPLNLGTKPGKRGIKSLGDFYDDDQPCLICGKVDRPDVFVLCDGDGCPHGGHCDCLELDRVPDGDWFCPDCAAVRDIAEQIKQVEAEGEELQAANKVVTLGSLETPEGEKLQAPNKVVMGTLGSDPILETPTDPESEDEGQEESFELRRVADPPSWEDVHRTVMPPPPSPGTMPPPPKKRPASTTPSRKSKRLAGTPAEKVTSPEPQEEYTEEKYEVYNKELWKIDKMYLGYALGYADDLYKTFTHKDFPQKKCIYVCDVPRPPNKGGGVDHYYRMFDANGNLMHFENCDENGNCKVGTKQKYLRSLAALTRYLTDFYKNSA